MSVPAVAQDWNLTAVGLQLTDPDLPYERFEELCWMLGQFHEAVRFAIGDAINLGEELYGERCYQALEALNLSEDARLEYARVSRRVPRSVRRQGVSWSHHRALAVLPPKEQKLWLARIAEQGLSHAALREELRDGEPAREVHTCRCCGRRL